MENLYVEPYIPDEDYDNPAMVTDFYEFTMANCLFLHGFKDRRMVFNMFYRENPDRQGYAISCGERRILRISARLSLEGRSVRTARRNGLLSAGADGARRMRYGRRNFN